MSLIPFSRTTFSNPFNSLACSHSSAFHNMDASELISVPVVDRESADFKANSKHMNGLLSQLSGKLKVVLRGGGDAERAKHLSRGKLMPRERVNRILDKASPFLELSPLAADAVYLPDSVPSAGIVTGIGRVHGTECMFIANDATVKGGTYYPLTIKKHLRAQVRLFKLNCRWFAVYL